MMHILRWISLPLAAVCLGGPLWDLAQTYEGYSGQTLTQAKVLSATVTSAGRMGSFYEIEARYPVNGGRIETNRLSVMVSFQRLAAGDTIWLFVDPKTGAAEDDLRLDSRVMVGMGALAAAFFVLVGFRYFGKILRQQT